MKIFPFLTLPLALFAIGVHTDVPYLDFTKESYGTITLPSGQLWTIGGFDIFAAFAALILIIEISKGISLEKKGLVTVFFEHVFSAVLCVVCVVLFLLVEGYGTSHILLLAVFAVCDVFVGVFLSARLHHYAHHPADKKSGAKA